MHHLTITPEEIKAWAKGDAIPQTTKDQSQVKIDELITIIRLGEG